jgi:hypothetical protein
MRRLNALRSAGVRMRSERNHAMKRITPLMLSFVLVGVLFAVSFGRADASREMPQTPAPVLELVSATPFELDEPYVYHWRKERPKVSSGYVLVLKVDPELVVPRQVAEPVLYVGKQTAERINQGDESGHVIALVPGVIDDPEHGEFIDLTKRIIWFGTPELPERVDAKIVEQEHQWAVHSGFKPFSAEQVEAAIARDGERYEYANKTQLVRELMELVRKYSPQEQDLINGVLAGGNDEAGGRH